MLTRGHRFSDERCELVWSACTHVGNIRTLNEDSYLAAYPVFAVADGMGGHESGEIASALTIEVLRAAVATGAVAAELVPQVIQNANRTVYDQAERTGREMGTTITGALVVDGEALSFAVVNVGDSRTYLRRRGVTLQLTVDHSYVQELVDEGTISADEALHHPQRNVVTRAIGIDPFVEVDVLTLAPIAGDRLLVCSDGLTGELSVDDLVELMDESDCIVAATRLVERVLAGPARDNVTVIVVDIVRVGPGDSDTQPRDRGHTTKPRRSAGRGHREAPIVVERYEPIASVLPQTDAPAPTIGAMPTLADGGTIPIVPTFSDVDITDVNDAAGSSPAAADEEQIDG